MDQAIIENISKMPANGNRLELPKNEQFSNYPALKKCLLTAGAKYVKCGFVFPEDAQVVKDRLIGGEAINDKKKFQFFATPPELAQHLVDLADVRPEHRWLEPSAGQGAIATLLNKIAPWGTTIELMPQNILVLQRLGFEPVVGDFLQNTPASWGYFDRIVANPPFTKNQDIDHVMHMYRFLCPGGKIVSIMSTSWQYGGQKKQVAFREWLDIFVDGRVTDVPAGTFKESGTNIATVTVEITKPEVQ